MIFMIRTADVSPDLLQWSSYQGTLPSRTNHCKEDKRVKTEDREMGKEDGERVTVKRGEREHGWSSQPLHPE